MVRSPEKGNSLGCPYVVGDFAAPETIRAALSSVDRVFLNSNVTPDLISNQNAAIDAAKAAGVSLIVKVSSAGAAANSSVAIGRMHAAIEEHLQASGVPWFSLRPTAFMKNLIASAESIRRDGRLVGAYKNGRTVFIDEFDIAACALALLTCARRSNEAFVLTGSEAFTYPEIAAKLSDKLGKLVSYVDVPVEQVVAQALTRGIPSQLARDFGTMMSSVAEGRGVQTTGTVLELTGRQPRTLDQFLDENLDVFRG